MSSSSQHGQATQDLLGLDESAQGDARSQAMAIIVRRVVENTIPEEHPAYYQILNVVEAWGYLLEFEANPEALAYWMAEDLFIAFCHADTLLELTTLERIQTTARKVMEVFTVKLWGSDSSRWDWSLLRRSLRGVQLGADVFGLSEEELQTRAHEYVHAVKLPEIMNWLGSIDITGTEPCYWGGWYDLFELIDGGDLTWGESPCDTNKMMPLVQAARDKSVSGPFEAWNTSIRSRVRQLAS